MPLYLQLGFTIKWTIAFWADFLLSGQTFLKWDGTKMKLTCDWLKTLNILQTFNQFAQGSSDVTSAIGGETYGGRIKDVMGLGCWCQINEIIWSCICNVCILYLETFYVFCLIITWSLWSTYFWNHWVNEDNVLINVPNRAIIHIYLT